MQVVEKVFAVVHEMISKIIVDDVWSNNSGDSSYKLQPSINVN